MMCSWSNRCPALSSLESEVTSITGEVLFHLRFQQLPMAPGIRYRTGFPSLQHFQQRDKLPRETIPMKLTWHGHSAFRIGAGAAKILIDPFLSDNPSWDKGWIGYRAGENSTQGGNR
jgi:hypothetical protein